jgi:hypothetical protein
VSKDHDGEDVAMSDRLDELEARVAELETELEIRDHANRGALANTFALLVRLLHEKGVLDERIVRNGLRDLFAPNPMDDDEEGRALHEVYQALALYQREAVIDTLTKDIGAPPPRRKWAEG